MGDSETIIGCRDQPANNDVSEARKRGRDTRKETQNVTTTEEQGEGKGQTQVGKEARRKSEVGLETETKWGE